MRTDRKWWASNKSGLAAVRATVAAWLLAAALAIHPAPDSGGERL